MFSLLQLIAQNEIQYPFSGAIQGQSGPQFFSNLLPALVTLGFVIGAIVFVFIFLIGGVQWISSGGDKAAVEKAKGKVVAAITGIFILFFLFGFINLVETFFDTSITNFNIGSFQIGGTENTGGSITGNANCPCSASLGGGCAQTNQVAIGPGSQCYQCTSSGWEQLSTTDCNVINCSSCP